jgi:hypothetical protein
VTHILTIRVSTKQFTALRAFAACAATSMNEVVIRALGLYLTQNGTDKAVEALFEQQRTQLRQAVEELAPDEGHGDD